jgi:hypothetical protein
MVLIVTQSRCFETDNDVKFVVPCIFQGAKKSLLGHVPRTEMHLPVKQCFVESNKSHVHLVD